MGLRRLCLDIVRWPTGGETSTLLINETVSSSLATHGVRVPGRFDHLEVVQLSANLLVQDRHCRDLAHFKQTLWHRPWCVFELDEQFHRWAGHA